MSKSPDKGSKEKPVEFFPRVEKEEYLFISPEGQQKLLSAFDPKEPDRNIVWTTDIDTELPIVMKAKGPGTFPL